MGVSCIKRHLYNSEVWLVPPSNPDPLKYKILDYIEYDFYLIVKIKYDDCTNFEGEKILVYEHTTLLDLLHQREIDPHFSDSKTKKYPIARFVPTQSGWGMANTFVKAMLDNPF